MVLALSACGDGPYVFVTISARDTVREAASLQVTVEDEASETQVESYLLARDHAFPTTLTVGTGGRSGRSN